MTAVILTIHTLIVLGLIVVVLLQRSDGGALGLGGGGGGFMSGRGAANALTRTTSILAALFFATSLGLAIYAGAGEDEEAVIEGLTGEAPAAPEDAFSVPSTDDLLQNLGGDAEAGASDDNTAEAPLTEQEILDNLGADAEVTEVAPASDEAADDETPSEENPEETSDPDQ